MRTKTCPLFQFSVVRFAVPVLEAVDGEPCIGLKVGKILGRHKMAKHFQLTISDGSFSWSRVEESIQKEASLDGIYVIRTSEPAEQLSAEDTRAQLQEPSPVERVFRAMKSLRAWAPMSFADEELPFQRVLRDPVLQAPVSTSRTSDHKI